MSTMCISGVIIDGMVYINTSRSGINLPTLATGDEGFTKQGWWFPTDTAELMTRVLTTGDDTLRHPEVVYSGTLIRGDGSITDIALAGPNYRIVSAHGKTPVIAIPEGRDSSMLSTFIEHLSMHPEIDPENGVWTIERIERICSLFSGNHHFKPYMELSEIVSTLSEMEILPFAGFKW